MRSHVLIVILEEPAAPPLHTVPSAELPGDALIFPVSGPT
jgi:hypothetical protein